MWIQHGSQHGLDFKSQAAHDKLQQLAPQREGQPPMKSIHDLPLVQTAEGLIHDPLQLPVLPKNLQHHHVK